MDDRCKKLEDISSLAGVLAHDFNNQITVIMGHASLVKSTYSEDECLVEEMEAIIDASKKASKLVEVMVNFSQRNRVR